MSFTVNGSVGVVIFIEINEIKFPIRTIFMNNRKIVHHELFIEFGSETIISMLLNFLTHAEK